MNFRGLVFVLLFLLSIYLIFQLSRSLWGTYRRTDRLDDLRQEITQLEKEKKRLLAQREYRQTQEYVEEEARNRLNMIREGERMVVLPQGLLAGENSAAEQVGPAARPQRNWEKWVEFWTDRCRGCPSL